MNYDLPHIISNPIGEQLIFTSHDALTDTLYVESYCRPGSGPVMHTHLKQDECLTVVSGAIAYEIAGEATRFAGPGETVLFKRGVAHRFWAHGHDVLHCKGWIQPANSIVFFLSSVFAAQNKTNTARPESFDAAFLMHRYASEYDMPEIPGFVKRFIFPLQVSIGKLLGKYRHFKNAPLPL